MYTHLCEYTNARLDKIGRYTPEIFSRLQHRMQEPPWKKHIDGRGRRSSGTGSTGDGSGICREQAPTWRERTAVFRQTLVLFFFEENGKWFAVIFIRRRKKIKIYKHTFNSTQLDTTENFKENKELLVNTSKTAKQRNHITTRGMVKSSFLDRWLLDEDECLLW